VSNETDKTRAEEFARCLYSKTDATAIGKFVDLSVRQAEFMREVIRQRDELLAALKIVTTGTVQTLMKHNKEWKALVAKCEASNNDLHGG
jgi:hypothetical protein